jgi:hypothetical protein
MLAFKLNMGHGGRGMMDAKRTANKYVEPGGYIRGERPDRVARDIGDLASFILWHDPGYLRGGITASEAWLAFCRVLALDPVEFRKIIKPDREETLR